MRVPRWPDAEPVAEQPPAEGDFLPVYAATESAWFMKHAPQMPETDPWTSPADTGWRAAEAAAEPALGGTTAAGLPKRQPRANLVPGSVPGSVAMPVAMPENWAGAAGPRYPPPPDAPRRLPSADQVRGRFAALQNGVRKGRAEIEDWRGGDSAGEVW